MARQRPPARRVIGNVHRTALWERLARTPVRRWGSGVFLMLAMIPVGSVASAALTGEPRQAGVLSRVGLPGFVEAPREFFTPVLAVSREPRPPGTYLVARSRLSHSAGISVYEHPGEKKRLGVVRPRSLERKLIPLVFLVQKRQKGWVRVHLPQRPNGALAWVRSRDVRIELTQYRLVVDLGDRRLSVFRKGKLVARKKIGVAKSVTPTPTGRYFLADLVKARNPKDIYGPYAFGLSAWSKVVTDFRGGEGQIGLHGTNAPEALGSEVSMGCIRVGNSVIRALARSVPLGTPVDIQR